MGKSILFNTDMVQAIIEDKKTTTRRVIKPKYSNTHFEWIEGIYGKRFIEKQNEEDEVTVISKKEGFTRKHLLWCREMVSPYEIGDILWVRETWKIDSIDKYKNNMLVDFKAIEEGDSNSKILVDFEKERFNQFRKFYQKTGWQPSLFMPREVARILLKVTAIRAERLHEMDNAATFGEGIRSYTKDGSIFKFAASEEEISWRDMPRNPMDAFKKLWESTIKKQDFDCCGWDANPWVWVIEFVRIENFIPNLKK